MPRPPRSPLFPYTTLFRSGASGQRGLRLDERHRAPVRSYQAVLPRRGGLLRGPLVRGRRPPLHGDRKSTRLNSSHLVISYAVFCLKKKSIYSAQVSASTLG